MLLRDWLKISRKEISDQKRSLKRQEETEPRTSGDTGLESYRNTSVSATKEKGFRVCILYREGRNLILNLFKFLCEVIK